MNSSHRAIIMALFRSAVAGAGLWGVMSPSGFLVLASGWPSWGQGLDWNCEHLL